MLAGAAAALYPALLPSSSDSAHDVTVYNAATGTYAVHVGLIWDLCRNAILTECP
jgi:cytochrome bd-type quinol oxidase subunit 2